MMVALQLRLHFYFRVDYENTLGCSYCCRFYSPGMIRIVMIKTRMEVSPVLSLSLERLCV